MAENLECNGTDMKADTLYRRGEHIFYKGADARILEVHPVFTIRISGTSHVICGNIFQDIKPSKDEKLST